MSEQCENCGGELVPHCLDCQDSEDLTKRWTINEADAAVERLEAKVAALTKQRDELRAACKRTEWVEIIGEKRCLTCGNRRKEGHDPSCSTAAALANTEEAN